MIVRFAGSGVSTADQSVSGAPLRCVVKKKFSSTWSDHITPMRLPKAITEQMSSLSKLLVQRGRIAGRSTPVSRRASARSSRGSGASRRPTAAARFLLDHERLGPAVADRHGKPASVV
jgi:hypothetical protein